MKKNAVFMTAVCLLTTAAFAGYKVTADRYIEDSRYDFTVQVEGSAARLNLNRKFFTSLLGSIVGDVSSVTVVELPNDGLMTYGGQNVVVFDTLILSSFKRLFITTSANNPATFTFIAINRDGECSPLCRLTVVPPKSAGAPTAFDVTVETAKGLKVGGTFDAADIDGGSLAYKVRSAPSKGDLSCFGGTFVYIPRTMAPQALTASLMPSEILTAIIQSSVRYRLTLKA